ncbi:hypothetical protein ACNKHP_23070 [Shigella boydii]
MRVDPLPDARISHWQIVAVHKAKASTLPQPACHPRQFALSVASAERQA